MNTTTSTTEAPNPMRILHFSLLLFSVALSSSLAAAITLEEAERQALANSPILRQAAARVQAAEGRARQAGLYPNPTIGTTGEHVTPEASMRWGSIGAFVEQRIVTAGKLRLDQEMARKSVAVAQAEQRAATLAVQARLRLAYYELLGAQERVAVLERSAETARSTAQTIAELRNIGMADLPDLKIAQVEQQRADLLLQQARAQQQQAAAALQAWLDGPAPAASSNSASSNAAASPQTNSPQANSLQATGDYRAVRDLQQDQLWEQITRNHPWLQAGQSEAERAEIAIRAARAARIPDLQARGGLRYNRELSDVARGARGPGSVGTEGIFDIGVEIPLFDRKQGLIAAAKAERTQWLAEVPRQEQQLRLHLAEVWRDYLQAKNGVAQYRQTMIPAAEESLALYLKNFRNMAIAYPNVLQAQRTVLQLREEELDQLSRLWRAVIQLETQLVLADDMAR